MELALFLYSGDGDPFIPKTCLVSSEYKVAAGDGGGEKLTHSPLPPHFQGAQITTQNISNHKTRRPGDLAESTEISPNCLLFRFSVCVRLWVGG